MPCDYKRDYPPNWLTEIRPAILERDHHRCVECGVPNHREIMRLPEDCLYDRRDWIEAGDPEWYERVARELGIAVSDLHPVKIILTIAHLFNHDPMDCRPENLASLCQRCHLRLDAPRHAAKRARNRALRRGQLELDLAS